MNANTTHPTTQQETADRLQRLANEHRLADWRLTQSVSPWYLTEDENGDLRASQYPPADAAVRWTGGSYAAALNAYEDILAQRAAHARAAAMLRRPWQERAGEWLYRAAGITAVAVALFMAVAIGRYIRGG